MHPVLGRLIVSFVLALVCFIAYSSQIFILWPWYGRVLSVELLYLLLPFKYISIYPSCGYACIHSRSAYLSGSSYGTTSSVCPQILGGYQMNGYVSFPFLPVEANSSSSRNPTCLQTVSKSRSSLGNPDTVEYAKDLSLREHTIAGSVTGMSVLLCTSHF